MSARSKALFKETPTQVRASKADQTTEIARQIAEKEAGDRAAKLDDVLKAHEPVYVKCIGVDAL